MARFESVSIIQLLGNDVNTGGEETFGWMRDAGTTDTGAMY